MVLIVLANVLKTILVPGPAGGRFRMILVIRSISLPLWRRAARHRRGRDLRPGNGFAPMMLALTFGAWTDDPACGVATLMYRSDARTATRLREMFGIDVPAVTCGEHEARAAIALLAAAAGYAARDDPQAAARFVRLRADYAGDLEGLADHLGANRAVLVPVPERGDDGDA